jgi:D-3-phosphoglycerate dehydrogenase / 2-oxoglutarate reductase
MILPRTAIEKFMRLGHARSTGNNIILRFKSTPVQGVQVEHGRGVWKTYGDLSNYKQGKYQIKTFNKISPIGLARFPEEEYDVRTGDVEAANAHAILLRSHKLQEEEVPKTVRAIAR